jgi:hypothetical protein
MKCVILNELYDFHVLEEFLCYPGLGYGRKSLILLGQCSDIYFLLTRDLRINKSTQDIFF